MYFKQSVVLPFFRLFRTDLLRDLNIDFFVLSYRHKINLSVARFPNIDGISSTAKFQMNNIFKAGSYAVSVIAENTVPQGNICKIKFFLCFQNLLALQIISGAAVMQICLFQLLLITVSRLVIKRPAF